MKNKYKLLITSLFTLIVSASLLTTFAFAWIRNSANIDTITLVAGQAEARVNGYMFKRQNNGLSTYVNATPNKVAGQLPSATNELIFTFADTTGTLFGDFDFASMYYNENSLNASVIPSYFVELQVRTIVAQSYIRITLWLEDYGVGETLPDFTDFGYRFHIASNSIAAPLEYATPTHVSTLSAKTLNSIADDFSPVNGIAISDSVNSYMQIDIPPADIEFYDTYFARSAIIEITPDPMKLFWFLRETNGLVNQEQLLGCRLNVTFEYSIVPFGA